MVTERYAGFDQPAGEERALAEDVAAVAVAEFGRLAGEVERGLRLRRQQQVERRVAADGVTRRVEVGRLRVELLHERAAGVERVEREAAVNLRQPRLAGQRHVRVVEVLVARRVGPGERIGGTEHRVELRGRGSRHTGRRGAAPGCSRVRPGA